VSITPGTPAVTPRIAHQKPGEKLLEKIAKDLEFMPIISLYCLA
jgi:hypothetical protein